MSEDTVRHPGEASRLQPAPTGAADGSAAANYSQLLHSVTFINIQRVESKKVKRKKSNAVQIHRSKPEAVTTQLIKAVIPHSHHKVA